MIWSRYNLLIDTPYGRYLYNSYTNNLIAVNNQLTDIVDTCEKNDFSNISPSIIESLKSENIIVDDDDDIYLKIKMERIMSRYDTKYLSLTIAPTTGCNFNCKYCYESGIKAKVVEDKSQNIHNMMEFVKMFPSAKYLRVTWYGGEPLLMFDYIESLTDVLKKEFENYSAYMITNGYLLDTQKASKLKGLSIKGLQITIDGLEETHNRRRSHKLSPDSFQTIINNLDNLFQIYPEINVALRVNIDKENEQEYHKIYFYLKEKYGAFNINIHPGYVTDEFSTESNSCCLMYDEIYNFVIKQYDNYSIPISLYPKTSFGECSARHITSFVIGPSGELYKCWNDIGLEHKIIGTISDFSMANTTNIRYLLDNDPLVHSECKNCFCFPICNGGCPYTRIYRPEELSQYCESKRKSIKSYMLRYIESTVKKKLGNRQ